MPLQLPHLSAPPAPPSTNRQRAQAAWFQRTHFGNSVPSLDVRIKALQQARKVGAQSTVGGSWTPLGPQPVNTGPLGYGSVGLASGRITALAVDPANSNVLWAGGANGGAWSSTDGGQHWFAMMDGQATLSVGAIAIDPTNPNTVYVGTGEANHSDSYWGLGVLKTTDGGATWITDPSGNPLGFGNFAGSSISKIVVEPDNNQIVLAAVCCASVVVPGGPDPYANAGVWRSTDGGMTWQAVLGGPSGASGANGDATDLVMDPMHHNILFAGIAYGNQSDTSAIYKSTDYSQDWTAVSLPLQTTATQVARASIGISQDGTHVYAALTDANATGSPIPPHQYGALLDEGIYTSADGGATWTVQSVDIAMWQDFGAGSKPSYSWWYTSMVMVDPTNPDVAYAGDVDLWRTSDGGVTWSNLTNGYQNSGEGGFAGVHVDQHALAFLSATSSSFYVGNDGGIWTSPYYGPFTNLNGGGLNITQFYGGSIGTSGSDSQLYGGSQDNGTDEYPAGSISGAQTWNETDGGDGLQVVVDPSNNANAYDEIAGTSINKTTNGGSGWSNSFTIPDSEVTFDNPAPLTISPNNTHELLLATDRLHKSTKSGNPGSWSNPSGPQFGSEKASSLAVASGDDKRIYVGAGGASGYVFVSTNGGSSFTKTATQPSPPAGGAVITGLAVDPNSEDTVYATFSAYGFSGAGQTCPLGNVGCHIWKTTDGGASWTDISIPLPNAPFHSIVAVHPKNAGCSNCPYAVTLVAGSDVGVFESADGGASWSQLGAGLPDAEVEQVFTDKNGTNIYAATHGRGIWTILIPHIGSGTVYFTSTDGYQYAVNGKTGALRWRYQVGSNESEPAVANGMVYTWQYLGNPIKLLALNASTGALVWSYTFPTTEPTATGVAVANGTVYLGVNDATSPVLDAFNGSTGALLWSYITGVRSGWPGTVAPTVVGGAVYLGINDVGDQSGDGYLFAVNASTGALLWRTLVGDILASAAADGTQVYVPASPYAGYGPDFFALNATTGSVAWSVEVGDTYASPTVANGMVYVEGSYFDTCSNSNCLFALNATTGALDWLYQMVDTGASQSSPAVANGIVYFGSSDYNIYAVNATNGSFVWQYLTGARVDDVAAANSAVYVGSEDGSVYSLYGTSGTPNWQYPTGSYYFPRPVIGP